MQTFTISTHSHNEIIDITEQVSGIVAKSKVKEGMCLVYTPHATAAIIINENADPNVMDDIIKALGKMVAEHDNYKHDRVDNNAAAHIKSSIIGPSEIIPVNDGKLMLGTWQDVMFCEFDGPRSNRKIIVQIIE